jgi:SAM-dependent methyltransferase
MGDDHQDPGLSLNDHEARNRADWNANAGDWVASAQRNWDPATQPHWGIWHVPESDLRALPLDLDLDGADVVELGCGTAYWSAWLAREGARPVGVDLAENQLETARAMQAQHGVAFPLVHASAERVPLPDAGFDLAFSEYGASLWADPYAWLPEAHRLLRPGGRLLFLTNSVLALLVSPPTDVPLGTELVRPQRGLRRVEWEGDPSVEFHLPHSEMMDLLRATGFEDFGLKEVYAPDDYGDPDEVRFYASRRWSRQWPVEEIWSARKAAAPPVP